jgi:hypothetical protein
VVDAARGGNSDVGGCSIEFDGTEYVSGGFFASFLLELLVYSDIYETWKRHFEVKRTTAARE